MKNNTRKNMLQKIIVALLLIILLFNFITPQIVLAVEEDEKAQNGLMRIIIKRNITIICILR